MTPSALILFVLLSAALVDGQGSRPMEPPVNPTGDPTPPPESGPESPCDTFSYCYSQNIQYDFRPKLPSLMHCLNTNCSALAFGGNYDYQADILSQTIAPAYFLDTVSRDVEGDCTWTGRKATIDTLIDTNLPNIPFLTDLFVQKANKQGLTGAALGVPLVDFRITTSYGSLVFNTFAYIEKAVVNSLPMSERMIAFENGTVSLNITTHLNPFFETNQTSIPLWDTQIVAVDNSTSALPSSCTYRFRYTYMYEKAYGDAVLGLSHEPDFFTAGGILNVTAGNETLYTDLVSSQPFEIRPYVVPEYNLTLLTWMPLSGEFIDRSVNFILNCTEKTTDRCTSLSMVTSTRFLSYTLFQYELGYQAEANGSIGIHFTKSDFYFCNDDFKEKDYIDPVTGTYCRLYNNVSVSYATVSIAIPPEMIETSEYGAWDMNSAAWLLLGLLIATAIVMIVMSALYGANVAAMKQMDQIQVTRRV